MISAVAGSSITLSPNHSTIHDPFDFDLLAVVGLSVSFQRQATTATNAGVFRYVDRLLAANDTTPSANLY